MYVSIQGICKFASATPTSRNFTEGENIVNRGHVLKCSKVDNGNGNGNENNDFRIIAYCLQTNNLKSEAHEVNGVISRDGRIIGMECTCKAELGYTCKHIVAVLLYCNRNDLENLNSITCTDKTCDPRLLRKLALEKYEAKPLFEHSCFAEMKLENEKKKIKNTKKTNNLGKDTSEKETGDTCIDLNKFLSTSYQEEFLRMMIERNPSSALAMHLSQ